MSDTQTAPATAPAVNDTPPPAATTPAAQPSAVSMPSDAFAKRLGEEREAARNKFLKDLGFEKPDELKTFIKSAKERADAELSETEKLKKALDEYKPRAERASSLEQRLAAVAQRELAALPEAARAAVAKHAGEDPDRILATIEMFREAGLVSSGAPAQQQPAAPAPAPANTASPASAPRPSGGRSKFDEWSALASSGNQMSADIFYGLHAAEIEKTRPAGR